jgi:Putative esterase
MPGTWHEMVPGRSGGGWAVSPRGRRLVVVLAVVLCAALAVAGSAGAVRYAVTFWLYRGFPAPAVPPEVAPTSVQAIQVASPALGGYRDTVVVVLPPGYASQPGRRYPVLYLLHGFPGLPSNFLTVGDIAADEATLVGEHRMQPLILVMPGRLTVLPGRRGMGQRGARRQPVGDIRRT